MELFSSWFNALPQVSHLHIMGMELLGHQPESLILHDTVMEKWKI